MGRIVRKNKYCSPWAGWEVTMIELRPPSRPAAAAHDSWVGGNEYRGTLALPDPKSQQKISLLPIVGSFVKGDPTSISRVAPPRVPGLHRHFTGLSPAAGSLHSLQPQARLLPLTGRTGRRRESAKRELCLLICCRPLQFSRCPARVPALVLTPPPYTIVLESESAAKIESIILSTFRVKTIDFDF